jgi:tetratricopeptide (TPR) repeat protein
MRHAQGKILTVMGLIALEQKDPGVAHKYLEESLSIARELNNKQLETYAVNNLALSEGAVKGNYALATEYYELAYKIAKEIGNRYQEGVSLANLGFMAGLQGNLSSAFLHHEHALLVAREIGNAYQEAYTLINLSSISGLQNDGGKALQYAKEANSLVRKIHDRSGEAWSWLYMGHAYLLTADYAEAHKAYQKSIALRNEMNQPALAMEPMSGLLEVALQANDMQTAALEAGKILAHLESGGSLEGTDEPLRVYYACYQYLELQKDPRAQRVLQKARHMLETQVSKFNDEQARKAFVENFPWRRAIFTASNNHGSHDE